MAATTSFRFLLAQVHYALSPPLLGSLGCLQYGAASAILQQVAALSHVYAGYYRSATKNPNGLEFALFGGFRTSCLIPIYPIWKFEWGYIALLIMKS